MSAGQQAFVVNIVYVVLLAGFPIPAQDSPYKYDINDISPISPIQAAHHGEGL